MPRALLLSTGRNVPVFFAGMQSFDSSVQRTVSTHHLIVYGRGMAVCTLYMGRSSFSRKNPGRAFLRRLLVIVLFQFLTGMLGQGMYYLIKGFSHG